MMFVCSSRPGRPVIHGASPRNMSSESFERNRISPIQMKSGSAVSVQLELAPQIVVTIASPTGREVKNSIAIQPTPSRATPIHTPVPSRKNSATRKTRARISCSTAGLFDVLLGCRGGVGDHRPAAQHPDQRLDEGDEQHADAD